MGGFRNTAKALRTLWPSLEAGAPEALHQARKLTRRAQAQLRVVGAPGRTRRAWRKLRRAVAPVRDHDVAGQHLIGALNQLGAPPEEVAAFQAAWSARRRRLFAAVKLPEPPPRVKRPRRLKARVREVLEKDARALLREAAAVLGSGEPGRWHEWRKHLKRYRYTLELTSAAPASLLQVLEHLGRLQDAQVARELLSQDDWLPHHRDALMDAEAAAARQARAQVREAWPALAEELRSQADVARPR